MTRFLLGLAASFAASALLAATAFAHAEFQSSTPAPGAVLTSAPASVTITFTEDLASGSTGFVSNAGRLTVSTGATISTTDRNTMTIALRPGLPNGAYTVFWHSVSADDGDVVDDRFSFTIAAAAAAPVAPGAPAAPAAPKLPSTSTQNTAEPTGPALALLALAAVLAGLSIHSMRRRGA